jgi:hypothetical protein
MVKTSILGVKNARLRKIFRLALIDFATKLLGTRKNLTITAKFLNYKETDKILGDCEIVDFAERPRYPREFRLNIDNAQSLRMQLRTLAHEMVHVKQFATNELYDYTLATNHTRFRDEIYEHSVIRYKEQPWEIEALTSEVPLVRAFLKEHKIKLKDYV